jgi:hypothetical protein
MSIMSRFPSKYLGAADITDGEIVTINSIADEKVGEEQELKPVIYFDEHPKGVVLNVTNAKALMAGYGDDESLWTGQKVMLFTVTVDFKGKSGPAIRMKPAKSAPTAGPTRKVGKPVSTIGETFS